MKRALLVLPVVVLGCGGAGNYVPRDLSDREPVAPVPRAASVDAIGDKPPAPFARRRRALRTPTETKLSNGVRVLLLEQHDFPTAKVTFYLDRGDTAAPPGLASIYLRSMTGATKDYTRKEAHEYITYLGAHWDSWHGADGLSLSVTALSPFLSKALAPVASWFTAASFDSDDVTFARIGLKGDLASARSSSPRAASHALSEMLFGADHPYAKIATPEGVDAIEKKDLVAFRDSFVVAERVTVVAVGDFDSAKLTARLEKLLGSIPNRKAKEAPAVPVPAAPRAARITLVPRKGGSQANVAIGFLGEKRGDPAHASLRVLSNLLGRGMSGRLDLKVRGEHGYSYGVSVSDNVYREAGSFVVTAAVDTAHAAEALKGMLAELARVRTEPVPAEELARAKRQTLDDLVASDARGSALGPIALGGLPINYFDAMAARVEALDAAALRAAAERYLTTEKVQIAVAGDESLAESLRSLNLGEVTVQKSPP